MKIRENCTCPLELTHDMIRGKWKTLLIFQLRSGPKSFSQLRREIGGISEKVLLEQLSQLCGFGAVQKRGGESYPLHVEYSLTERGRQLLSAVDILQKVGADYMLEHGQRSLLLKKGIHCPPAQPGEEPF